MPPMQPTAFTPSGPWPLGATASRCSVGCRSVGRQGYRDHNRTRRPDTLYLRTRGQKHHEPARVPVLLENPAWVRPFEPLISFLNTPRYDSWDPTWITATLFPLWVGMIIGDVGYGLVFAGIAWYLSTLVRRKQDLRVDFFKMRLAPEAVAQVVRIMKPMIAWTILWGFVYGECFGNLFLALGIFGTQHHQGLVPTLIPRTETAATAKLFIVVSIGFGIIQVLHGFILKAQMSRLHGERKHFWEASGYFGGVTALVLFGYAFMTGSYPAVAAHPDVCRVRPFCGGNAPGPNAPHAGGTADSRRPYLELYPDLRGGPGFGHSRGSGHRHWVWVLSEGRWPGSSWAC